MLVTYVSVGLPLASVSMIVRGVDMGRGVLVTVVIGTPSAFVTVITDGVAYAGGISLINLVTVVAGVPLALDRVTTSALMYWGSPSTTTVVMVVNDPMILVSVTTEVLTPGAPGSRTVIDVSPTLVGTHPGRPAIYSSEATFVVVRGAETVDVRVVTSPAYRLEALVLGGRGSETGTLVVIGIERRGGPSATVTSFPSDHSSVYVTEAVPLA